MDATDDPYRFSAATGDVDAGQVHRWLSEQSYWARGRTRAQQDAAIGASRNYGLYEVATGRQVACARVVTDGTTFAWLCDVFVDPAHRGRSLGKRLVAGVLDDLSGLPLTRVLLATEDAHGLYEQFGFTGLERPSIWMVRRPGATPPNG